MQRRFLRKRGAVGVPAPPWESCRAATEGLLMEKRKKR